MALSALYKAKSLGLNTPNLHYHLGYNFNRTGLHKQALDSLSQTIVLQKDHYHAFHERGEAFMMLNLPNDAQSDFKKFLSLVLVAGNPNPIVRGDWLLYYCIGKAYYVLGNREYALNFFEQARALGGKASQLDEFLKLLNQSENSHSPAASAAASAAAPAVSTRSPLATVVFTTKPEASLETPVASAATAAASAVAPAVSTKSPLATVVFTTKPEASAEALIATVTAEVSPASMASSEVSTVPKR